VQRAASLHGCKRHTSSRPWASSHHTLLWDTAHIPLYPYLLPLPWKSSFIINKSYANKKINFMKNILLKKVIVILGPTSSGKSDIAIKLAKKFDGEIISADSRQIFRGMDIGTGKSKQDRRSRKALSKSNHRFVEGSRSDKIYTSEGIPHYMIDIVSPRTEYNVAKFKKQSEKIIEDILLRDKLPIICGGTGFWIQAIVDNINFPQVKPDWNLRKKLEKYSADKLFAMLKKLDSQRAKNIDAKNKVRLIRAIEICKAIKKVPALAGIPSEVEGSSRRNTDYQFLQIGLKLSKDKLYKNIEKRVKARFKQGMIREVENLHSRGLSWKKIQSFGLAYFWIPLYLQNKLYPVKSREAGLARPVFNRVEKDKLFQKVIQAEKNYAKRQMTWFKRDKRIKWRKNYKEINKTVNKFYKKASLDSRN
jgi:tRNA dimethylallyltransferase